MTPTPPTPAPSSTPARSALVFGAWDSSRRTRQGRWRSLLVGEIIGFCADPDATAGNTPRKGGARVDPVGMQIQLTESDLKALATRQKDELSPKTYDKILKDAGGAKAKGLRVGKTLDSY